jgi:SAM-dependent methyltransferase
MDWALSSVMPTDFTTNRRDRNLDVYNESRVAAHYARLEYLSECELHLFQSFLKPGMAILDLGVGGGRTTPYLSAIASRYVGADYASEMVSACRNKFPTLEFKILHAADLREFESEHFDAVIMAFNSIDYVIPDNVRARALCEIHRVLKNGGVVIFSSHNPRAFWVRPGWSRSRVQQVAAQVSGGRKTAERLAIGILTILRAGASAATSIALSAVRLARRLPKRAFWRGEGYMMDNAHGGLLTHYAVPEVVITELTSAGFRLLKVLGDDYPAHSKIFVTDWYYYVFSTVQKSSSPTTCE